MSFTRERGQRFQTRFDRGEGQEKGAFADSRRIVRFKRLGVEKRKASYIRLLILLGAAIWAYIYFTNFK